MQDFAVNLYLLPHGDALPTFLDRVAATGAGGVGVTQRALDEVPARQLRQMLRTRGLRATSVNSAGFFLQPDPGRAAAQNATNQRLIAAAAELEAEVLVIIPGGLRDAPPATTIEAARAMIGTALDSLVRDAVSAGVQPGLEVMHPVAVFGKGCINTLGEAAELCEAIPSLKLVLDVFHSWWDPDLPTVASSLSQRIALVQLCNVLESVGEGSLPVRSSLSEGVVDLAALLRTLDAAGYVGFFEFEMFADQLQGRAPSAVIHQAARDFAALRAIP